MTASPFRKADPEEVARLHASGMNGAEIARVFGVSRERIRQIILRDLGIRTRQWRGRCKLCDVAWGEPGPVAHRLSDLHRANRHAQRAARFWAHADKTPVPPSTCWEWMGSRNPVNGYGQTSVFVKNGYAHRIAYELAKGPIPKGLTIDHLCRNRGCVNPAHLEAVTHRVNILRSPDQPAANNARKTECIHGHPFTEENTAYTPNHGRICRTCRRERDRERHVHFGAPRPAPKPSRRK